MVSIHWSFLDFNQTLSGKMQKVLWPFLWCAVWRMKYSLCVLFTDKPWTPVCQQENSLTCHTAMFSCCWYTWIWCYLQWYSHTVYFRHVQMIALPLLCCFETVFGCVAVQQQRAAAAENQQAWLIWGSPVWCVRLAVLHASRLVYGDLTPASSNTEGRGGFHIELCASRPHIM